jgi:hypothetical protein
LVLRDLYPERDLLSVEDDPLIFLLGKEEEVQGQENVLEISAYHKKDTKKCLSPF